MNKLMNTLASAYPEDSINHKSHPDHNKPGFMVRATQRGYYGLAMREEGDVFRIAYARHFADSEDDALSGLGWMEKVENAGKAQKRQSALDDEARGAKPAASDPAERQRRMKASDKMAEESLSEDKDKAEADMI